MESFQYIHERLKKERLRLGLKQEEVIEQTGNTVSRQTFSKYEKGESYPNAQFLSELAKLGFDVNYIITDLRSLSQKHIHDQENKQINEKSAGYLEKDQGNDERDQRSLSEDRKGSLITEDSCHLLKNASGSGKTFSALKALDELFARIPLFDVKASAGNGYVIHHEEETDALIFKREWIYNELHSTPANLYLIYVEGESMEPSLRPGDVILVDHTDNVAKRDGIYVIRMGDSLLVKRLQRLPNRVLKVNSDNPDYESFEISLDVDHGTEFMIIGRVVWSGRRH